MRVAFNATPLLSPLTGIGNYIVELGAALGRCNEIDPYSFYRYRWRHESPRVPEPVDTPGMDTVVERMKPILPLRGPLRHAAKYLGFRSGLHHFRIDLYHEQNYIPLSFERPVAITVHDLSWLRYPESHPVDRVRWLERGLPRAIEKARVILVDSNFIRDEVLTTFGVDETRVHTAHLGVQDRFIPRQAEEVEEVLASLGLQYRRYVLTVGTIEPRKNLRHILDAYDLLPKELCERYPLVVAGAKGWQSSDLMTRIRTLSDRHVRFIGHVSGSSLPDLYAGAALFVFPSLYEGFGLTPLEAMASGVPVIASRRASIPEVVGEAGELLDPEDPAGTAQLVQSILEQPERMRAMATSGRIQASKFTWDNCAAKTLQAYRQAIAREEN